MTHEKEQLACEHPRAGALALQRVNRCRSSAWVSNSSRKSLLRKTAVPAGPSRFARRNARSVSVRSLDPSAARSNFLRPQRVSPSLLQAPPERLDVRLAGVDVERVARELPQELLVP